MEDNAIESTVLWLSAHPEPSSLNGSLRTTGIEYLRTLDRTVLESDLYAMEWDPVVRPHDAGTHASDRFRISADTRTAHLAGTQPDAIVREQEKLRRADALVVQFPLWWYGMPAILKGWFDRVFVSGFAFGTDETTGRRLRFEQGQFTDKRALVISAFFGAAVSELNEDDLQEVYLLRGVMEGLAAKLAAEKRTDDDLKRVRSLLERAEVLIHEEYEPGDLAKLSREFHDEISRIGSPGVIAPRVQQLWFAYPIPQSTSLCADREWAKNILAVHRQMLEALERGDGEAAERLGRDHVHATGRERVERAERGVDD